MLKYGKMILGAFLLTFVLTFATGMFDVKAAVNDKIQDGVYIGNIDVGGMTTEEAKEAIQTYIDQLKEVTFTLQGAAGSFDITTEEMGLTVDADAAVEDALKVANTGNLIERYKEVKSLETTPVTVSMHLSVDRETLGTLIKSHRSELNIKAVDNTLKHTSSGIQYVAGSAGQTVAVEDSMDEIVEFLEYTWNDTSNTIDLVLEIVEPKGSKEELSKVKDVLGSYKTDYSGSSESRKANVENAASKINGTILYPGESFSAYDTISPITEENGYEIAKAYSANSVVDSVGGGVCQVATTLYNAVIRAELKVTKRYNHSMIVTYVDPSMDAAISGTTKDLRFYNNTDAPVYIYAGYNGSTLTFKIYGQEYRDSGRTIKFVSETLSEEEGGTEINWDSEQPLGYVKKEQSAHKGIVARLWKVVYENGVEVSRDIFNKSTYAAGPRIYTVGVSGATSEQKAALKAAAAEDDIAKLKSLATSYASANAKAKKAAESSSEKSSTKSSDSTSTKSSEKSSTKSSETSSDSKAEETTTSAE